MFHSIKRTWQTKKPDIGRVLTGLLVFLLFSSEAVLAIGGPGPGSKGKMKIIRNSSTYRGPKLQFLEISGGYGFWARSAQTGFKTVKNPISGSVEYGNTHSPISYGIGAITGTHFQRDDLSLQNQHATAFGKYRISYPVSRVSNVEFYAMGGINTWQSKLDNLGTDLTEFSIPGGQKETGIGMLLGAGFNYRYAGIGIGGQFLWLTGKANYRLSNESKVGVLTGSMQANVVLSYRIIWGRKSIKCPIYSK